MKSTYNAEYPYYYHRADLAGGMKGDLIEITARMVNFVGNVEYIGGLVAGGSGFFFERIRVIFSFIGKRIYNVKRVCLNRGYGYIGGYLFSCVPHETGGLWHDFRGGYDFALNCEPEFAVFRIICEYCGAFFYFLARIPVRFEL